MIEFRHQGRAVRLESGALHSSPIADSYRDTTESAGREVVRRIEAGEPWRKVVDNCFAATKPWLHRIITSERRDKFFRDHPPATDARVLDIGAGWGQTALPLARSCRVTAVEPTPERMAFIRAAARQEAIAAGMHFVQADFLDLEFPPVFDVVACIGVLEWVPNFRAGEPRDLQVEFLRQARAALAPGGRLVIGIENRVGLKYLLGAPDDHLGVPHIGMLDHALARRRWREKTSAELRVLTHTVAEYRSLLSAAGFPRTHFFAAYPDYKLPEFIIPADGPDDCARFVKQQHAVPEHNGANGTDLPMLEEIQSVHRALAELQVAHLFAPSYFIVAHI